MTKIGIIGTGFLGRAVAIRLLNTGHEVTVYNRTAKKAESLREFGAEVASSPKDVARACDLVITVVKDAKAVEEVAFGKDGIVEGRHDGLVVAEMSTINPISSRKIAQKFSENGITMIDTPVMGGPNLVEKGEVVVMIGGDKKVYEKYKKVFDFIGNKHFHLGDNGSGHAMKLVMNIQIAILALGLSEGITLARAASLNPETFLEILNSTYFKTGMSVNKGPKMIKGNFEPTFSLKMMKKDLDTISEAAKQLGISLPVSSLANRIYQDAESSGFADIDYTGILAFIDKMSGLKKN
ncbi:MAG: NAD(P)-dependent oxidoreductase [Thaumarchaeota archaeon]|nr:NAD(P)-dependent oxidoreductase [Nitrososphaerota archaeon]